MKLDMKTLNMFTLDNYRLDKFKADAYKLDGLSASGGFDSYVKSLLHFNGANNSTIFTDETGKTWTSNNGAALDSANKKFGTASGLFVPNAYIDTPDSADFDVGSGDYTYDFQIKRNTLGSEQNICGQTDSGLTSRGVQLQFDSSNYLIFQNFYSGSSYKLIQSSVTVADTNWHHVALVRYGNTTTLYIDGTARGTVDVTGITFNNSTGKFAIGRYGEYAAGYFSGWIDEFRFSKGIARWTTNFTPPTAEYA